MHILEEGFRSWSTSNSPSYGRFTYLNELSTGLGVSLRSNIFGHVGPIT